MSAFKNDGPQVAQYTYDFDVDGGALGVIDLSAKAGKSPLPVGAIVTDVTLVAQTAVTSGGSARLYVQYSDAVNQGEWYNFGTPALLVADAALGPETSGADTVIYDQANDHRDAFKVKTAAEGKVQVDIAVAALTAGKVDILITYSLPA